MNNLTLTDSAKLEQDVRNLIVKHKAAFEENKLIEDVIKYTFKYMGVDNKIKTDYMDSYCDLFMQYAAKYPNANGFWGKYRIDEGVKQEWIDNNQRFKQTISLVPNITANLMNQNIDFLIETAGHAKDIKTSVQICLKLVDMVYKTDKDGGTIKERAQENRQAKKRALQSLDDDDISAVEEFLGDI